jgi:hypothetical protein
MKRDYPSLKAHYRFSKEDEEFLLQLRPLIESHVDEFLEGFHKVIWEFGKTSEFLKYEEVIIRHRGKLRQW